MKKPTVSIIIPSYNRGYCIEACIRSALVQSYVNIEVIVVDDASTDDTRERVESIADFRLHYVAHGRNRGGAAARNTGIRHATGEYIAFLDSDDRWLPDKLEKQMWGLLSGGGDYGLSYTWLLCVDDHGKETMRMCPEYEGDCSQQILISNFIGSFSNVVIRRDLLAMVGGLDESMKSCQDWDLFIRLLRITRVHCQREYLVHYRQSSGDAVRISSNPKAVVQGHRRILDKFASEYRTLPRDQRRQAMQVYFNTYAAIGAFSESLKTGTSLVLDRFSFLDVWRLSRGLARAAKRSLQRSAHTRSLSGATAR